MNRQVKILAIFSGAAVFVALLEGLVLFQLSRTQMQDSTFRARLLDHSSSEFKDSFQQLKREALTRAALYNSLIEQNMLIDGMVISRNEDDKPDHLCDSLLFSSLRYRALVALDFIESANRAWTSIQASRDQGTWWRHPLCSQQSLSRDMLMGLMIALDAKPPEGGVILEELLGEISKRRGSFSNGPFFVSYLSPGPAGLLRHLAESYRIPYDGWPWVLEQSFSSVEYDTLFLKPGFESHLAALGLWLEERFRKQRSGFNPRSMLGQLDRFVTGTPLSQTSDFDQQRLVWIANTITQQNPENLFFVTLQLDIQGALNDQVRANLLTKLLSMPQFPVDRLPMDCDRDADYLWQRKTEEYNPTTSHCRRTYAGVDFLWLASLLIADSD